MHPKYVGHGVERVERARELKRQREHTDQNAARPQIGITIKAYSYVHMNTSSYWFSKIRALFHFRHEMLVHFSPLTGVWVWMLWNLGINELQWIARLHD